MSLKDLFHSEVKLQCIKIKVLATENENLIVGDSSMLAICSCSNDAYRNMKEGQSYMILRPLKKDDNTFIPPEKLKPVKINNMTLKPSKIEINKLQALLKSTSQSDTKSSPLNSTKLITLQEILEQAAKSEIKSVTVKIISISKDIKGTYGIYNIAKLKDINKEKIDINLYNKQVRSKFRKGEVVELKRIKLTEFTKDGQAVKRLVTTTRSAVEKCNVDTETLFKNVPLGDEQEEGKVIAVHDIFPYLSCSICWRKTHEEETTCQCENSENIHVNDFHCQFYIQIMKNEDIKVVHTFRRQTNLDLDTQDPDVIQKTLEDSYLNKVLTFEWNRSNNDEEEELKMINISDNISLYKETHKLS